MSYLRGQYYTWVGNSCPEDCPTGRDNQNRASACPEHDYIMIDWNARLPLRIFDLLVVMRYAEMQEEGLIERAEEEAIQIGNFGSFALQRKHGMDPEKDLRAYLDEVVARRDQKSTE